LTNALSNPLWYPKSDWGRRKKKKKYGKGEKWKKKGLAILEATERGGKKREGGGVHEVFVDPNVCTHSVLMQEGGGKEKRSKKKKAKGGAGWSGI